MPVGRGRCSFGGCRTGHRFCLGDSTTEKRVTNTLRTLRKHWPVLTLAPIAIIVMTWPTFWQIFDAGSFWLPTQRDDIYMLFWDGWYSNFILTQQADFFFTDLKFHPDGVSLAFHNFSLPHMFLFGGLSAIMPRASAFNLTYLLLVFVSLLSAYVYLWHLLRDRWLAFFGVIVFGVSGFVLARPATPHISFVATVPLSLYFLHRALAEDRWKCLIAAGALTGFTAFVGLYTLVCLLITAALYVLCFARARWRQFSFWSMILCLALVAGALGAARILPMLADADGLSNALAKNIDQETGKDLLGYFVNYENPITGPLLQSVFASDQVERGWPQTVYLGYVPMLLVALGLASARMRSRAWPWLALALIFLLLRLGSTLAINDVVYESIRLPKFYLTKIAPQVFLPFWSTDQFFAGAVFPFALLACYGMQALLRRLPSLRHVMVILIVSAMVAFEYYQAPDPLVIPDEQLAFLTHLNREADPDSVNLINLPLGGNQSKVYDFYQTYNGYPQVEGRPTRAPASAYNYIDDNLLLKSWKRFSFLRCLPSSRERYLTGLNQLLSDGFSHIVFHQEFGGRNFLAPSFAGLQPAYEDRYTRIYRLRQLAETCDNESIALPETFAHLRQLALSPSLIADDGMSIVSFHPAEGMDGETLRYLSSLFLYWKSFEHVSLLDGRRRVQRFNADDRDAPAMPAGNQVIVLSYDPRRDNLDSLREDFAAGYRVCGRFVEAADAIAEYYAPVAFPCALVAAADKFEVAYDSQLRLTNLLYEVDGSSLSLFAWWTEKPDAPQAISLQIFDAAGGKVAGQDFTVGVDPLARYQVDLSSLEAGDYSLKMIVYNYETRASAAGTVISDGTRFERELEIGPITVG